jgi:hypothetical protein
MGLWFALEDATAENGCLSFVPGSHKTNEVTGGAGRSDPLDLGSFPVHFGNVFRPWYSHDVSDKSRFIYTVRGPGSRERDVVRLPR